MKKLIFLLLCLTAFGCHDSHKELTHYVNPFIGTDGHGHTYPGATRPFGMVQLSPDTRKDNWDACSGYHYSDSTILGFSHTHLSGTGVGDYGDVRFMPVTGKLHLLPGEESNTATGYRSRFSHQKESAKPGYYKVFLEDYGIEAELTATPHCGFHQYTFTNKDQAHLVIDLFESVTSDIILESGATIVSDREISGFRRTRGWANDQVVYFYASFSEAFDGSGIVVDNDTSNHLRAATGTNIKAYVDFSDRNWNVLKIKIGISPVSIEGAKNNMEEELPGWNFEQIVQKANEDWNDELGRIEIKKGREEDKIKFYTALYHACLAPNIFSDCDGSYRGHDGKIYQADKHTIYTVFSIWDTYRALHPLMTIIQPERTADFIYTMLDIYDKGGLLPVWELAGNETFCMIGYHAVPVIVDAAMKGYRDFDLEHALDAMKTSAEADHFGLKAYRDYGYIPANEEGESVSKTLEYAYDDWCIATMAKLLGKEADYKTYIKRAQYYKNLFDPGTGFIRGKRNSTFVDPFDPAEVNFMLTEANTWQYTFYVPQDIDGLMTMLGGPAAFSDKLDALFNAPSELTGRNQSDITGLIGQYAHGNEPSHHEAYLYNYCGEAFKTQALVRKIMKELYGTGPDGLCGNEDCGQMSAWFVMSAMGFYPVTPGDNQYAIGSPLFEEIILHLPGNKKFTIKASNNSPENTYIQSASMNGKPMSHSFLLHENIMKGGEICFTMGPRPSESWGTAPADWPRSSISDHLITPVPYYRSPGMTFRETIQVTLNDAEADAKIYYTMGSQAPTKNSLLYQDTLSSDKSFKMNAVAYRDSTGYSLAAPAEYRKIDNAWSIMLKNPYNSQYSGGGDLALVDGETGGSNFRTGGWQGYQGVDFEAVIDLGRKQVINSIFARFLDDQNSWIFLPVQVEISISDKPYDFKVITLVDNPVTETNEASIHEFGRDRINATARYIKVVAKNTGTCPDWHKGAGGKAWLFIDEIKID